MRIEILESTERDLIEGFQFYEQQSTGLGNYFLDSLFSDIDSLLIYSGIHVVYHNHFFQMQSKRFPFTIYYKLSDDIVKVYAVLDTRKNPAWLREKIENL